jgi:hypothetical protein
MIQTEKVQNLREMALESSKCMITALFYRMTARAVIVERLAVIENFIAGLLQQPE